MAITNPQDTFKVTLGGEAKDVLYTKKVYGRWDDVTNEAFASPENESNLLKNVNDAVDADLKAAARLKFLGLDENSKTKAIDDQVKSYINQRKKAGKPYDEAAVRARFIQMAEE